MRRALCVLVVVGGAAAACSDPADDDHDNDGGVAAPTSTILVITITDGENGPPLPGRVVLYGEDGKPVHIGKLDLWDGTDQGKAFCELGPGVTGSWDGILLADGTGELRVGDDDCSPSPAVPYGRYRLVAFQGIEHEMFETQVDLEPRLGKVQVRAPLRRAWSPGDALSADLHVHAVGSSDSWLPRKLRVVTERVAGIQVIGASDHNFNSTYDDTIDELGLRGQIASLTGNEVTVDLLHANVFPAVIQRGAPGQGAVSLVNPSAQEIWSALRRLPFRPLVQLNHPRLRYAAYYDYVGWNGESWPPPMPIDFDAVEVLNGMSSFNLEGDPRIMRSAEDLYTFVDHGHLITGVANSDTHHLTSNLAGLPRNYVFAADPRLDPFDEDGFIDALRQRRVLMTTGPWLDVRVNGAGMGELGLAAGGKVTVSVTLRMASYVQVSRVRVLLGRQLVHMLDVPAGATRFDWSGEVAVGPGDGWIAVDALGTAPLPRELHGMAPAKNPMPAFAMINPILVDGDGDGRYTARPEKPWVAPHIPAPPPGSFPDACVLQSAAHNGGRE